MHLKKEGKKRRLKELLGKVGVPYNEYQREDGYVDVAFLAPQENKTYKGWWSASQKQLEVIRDECVLWDGCTGRREEFRTTVKEVADFIQYVGVCTGSKTSINVSDRRGQEYSGGYVRKSVEYVVRFQKVDHHGLSRGSGCKPEITHVHEAREYCFTVPTGMFVIRQAGHVSVTGNSELCKVTQAYHLHILGCLKNPQKVYSLPQATSIVIVIQAAKPHVTKKVIYLPLRNYVETMPWFQKHMRPNKLVESEMYFEDLNIRVVPGGSESDTILGEAIISGMNIVQKSKKADVGSGRAGIFDQAKSIYDAVTKRRKGRFTYRGPHIGVICVASSTRYKGDFTDKRMEHVEQYGLQKNVFIYNKAQYEVTPQDRYCGEKFRVYVSSDAAMDIRILEENEATPSSGSTFEVPIEYLDDFRKDAAGSLRDVVGRSVNSVNPFFRQPAKIMECVSKGIQAGVTSFLTKDNVVLGYEGLPLPIRGHFCKNPSKPRYVHIDLSKNQDRCGIGMVRFDGMDERVRRSGDVEYLPIATVEMAVSVEPDQGNEIDIAEIRAWVKMLKVKYGYPIKVVTYDGWSSLESQQAWKKQGMKTGMVSVDRTAAPYKQFRDAIYDGRVLMYDQPLLLQELFDLEFDEAKDKVDHPAHSSKDCADGVCGAYHVMLTRASSWQDPGKYDEHEEGDEEHMGDRHDASERQDMERF
jgi:hypothetical protein